MPPRRQRLAFACRRNRRLRPAASLVALAACGLLAAAPSAYGAVTIGSDLSATPASGCVLPPNQYLCTLTQLAPTSGATLALTAPSTGVITQIRLKHGPVGTTGNSVGFRILTPTEPPSNEFTAWIASPSGTGGTFATSTSAGIDTFHFYDDASCPRGVAIYEGERLGVYMGSPDLPVVSSTGSGAGEYANENHYQDLGAYQSRSGELLLQATIEPDANEDGYGDETQSPNCGGSGGGGEGGGGSGGSGSGSGTGSTNTVTTATSGSSTTSSGQTSGSKKKRKRSRRSLRFFYGIFSTYVPGTSWSEGGATWVSTGAKGTAIGIAPNHVWRWHGLRGHWRTTGESDYPLVLRHALDGHDWKVGKAVGAAGCTRSQIVLWDGYTWYCGRRVRK
jgi:hypothetical protein